MHFTPYLVALAAYLTVASAVAGSDADSSQLQRRITDPGNPANLVNCEPGGGTDSCNLEKPCNRIRINYGSRQGGHYIWYNYDINNIPAGAIVGVEDSCTDYKREELVRRMVESAIAVRSADSVQLQRRISDPGNPANLVNCEPKGGADSCNLEKPCGRIRINYGSRQGGHYIWYNYDINNIPAGAIVGVEASCTDYKRELTRRISDPGNPANLVNCEPKGGADSCNLEQPCGRIRINYGSRQGGHYIWYNYDINSIPAGAIVGVEDSCTDYKREELLRRRAASAIAVRDVASSQLVRRIADPGNPANLVNCEPGGGADDCNLEQPCSRIRINYGSRQGGHYIWYSSDINNIPSGAIVGVEASCTDYKRDEL